MAQLLPVCAFGQSRTFALTSIKKYVPSPCHEATVISTGHAQAIYPASLLAGARMPVVDQNTWDSVRVCNTGSSDRCVHKVAQPTHVAGR